MPDDTPNSSETALPESLREQLAEFQRHLWRIKVMEAVFAGFLGLIASFLLVFILDRFIPTSGWFRLAILLGGTSLFAIFAPLWIRRWVYGHRREEQLARLISKKFPKLGDRLLGVVELQDQHEERASLSPELREAAMAHVARQAGKRDMNLALPISRHKKLAFAVTLTTALTIAGFTLTPKAGLNSLKRWLFPFSETERYTFTQLDLSEIPNPYTVPYDEPFSLILPLSKDSDDAPLTAEARYGQQDWLTSPLEETSYTFDFKGQKTPNILTLSAGDATHRLKVEPLIRPSLSDLKAHITLPDYLQLENRDQDIRTGVLTALEGSTVSLRASFTRDLARAQGTHTPIPTEDPDVELPAPFPLKISTQKHRLSSAPFTIGLHRAEIPLSWTDVKGLDGPSQFLLRIEPAIDARPSAYIQGISRQLVILAEETLEFDVLCEDDFGLREIGLSWEGQFTKPTDVLPAKGELILKQGSPSASRLSERAVFSPKTHQIIPQKLLLRAYTEDYKPERGRIYSEPLVIYILTRDEHAQMLKNRFDRIIGELEDAARREQNNLDTNKRLKKKKDENLQTDEGKQQLAESEKDELENADSLSELTNKMEQLFKDATRNGDLDKDTMKKMAEAMENMRELSQKDLPEIAKKLNQSQDQKNTAEKSAKDLQEAITKQEQALKKMQETIKQANQANQNFEASTFINRLKRAARDEDGIGANLIAAINEQTLTEGKAETPLLGASVDNDELDPVHERLLENLNTQQKRTSADIRWIQEDLGHFYARTQKPEHKELLTEMRDSQIDIGLENLRREITSNHSFRSIHVAKKWSARLLAWAKKLEGDNGGGAGGGGGGAGGSQQDKDFEFMLKVMRMVQKEQDIRARTRSLEQLKRSLKLSPVEKP